MVRAFWADVGTRPTVQGGSTITQQFVKNALVTDAAHDHAQAEGGARSRGSSSAALVEGQDPDRVPEHDLLRERRLRRRARRAHVLRPQRDEADAARGGAARGDPEEPSLWDPVAHPRAARERRAHRPAARCSSRATSRTRVRRTERAPMPQPRTCTSPASRGQAPYFTNYVKQQLVEQARRASACSAAASACTRRSTCACRSSRTTRSHKWLTEPGRAERRARRDRPARRARSSRWSAAATTTRASSTSRCRASASRARRSSRSCSRPRSSRASSPQTTFDSKPMTIFLGDKYWHGAQLRGRVPRPDRPRRRRHPLRQLACSRS